MDEASYILQYIYVILASIAEIACGSIAESDCGCKMLTESDCPEAFRGPTVWLNLWPELPNLADTKRCSLGR